MRWPHCRYRAAAMVEHAPVMCNEVRDVLAVAGSDVVVDLTFGRGGHARALLAELGPAGRYIAIDRDPEAVAVAADMALRDTRVIARHGRAGDLEQIARELGVWGRVSAVLADLGVSSPQIGEARRGFSFLVDGPLDMRMDPTRGASAAEWVNNTPEGDMAAAFREYGEERFARRIARAIAARRAERPFRSTVDLAEVVARAHPAWERHRHPATRVFQAIRIAVNDELEELRRALDAAVRALEPGGRLAVISFHSLEDRIVKRFIRDASRAPDPFAPSQQSPLPRLERLTRALRPGEDEVAGNPRARSAVLRAARRMRERA